MLSHSTVCSSSLGLHQQIKDCQLLTLGFHGMLSTVPHQRSKTANMHRMHYNINHSSMPNNLWFWLFQLDRPLLGELWNTMFMVMCMQVLLQKYCHSHACTCIFVRTARVLWWLYSSASINGVLHSCKIYLIPWQTRWCVLNAGNKKYLYYYFRKL